MEDASGRLSGRLGLLEIEGSGTQAGLDGSAKAALARHTQPTSANARHEDARGDVPSHARLQAASASPTRAFAACLKGPEC